MVKMCKVLIAEDEVIIRQGIKHLIDWQAHGFEIVAETSNGKEALEKIKLLRPNIVLTDITMPVMNGLELIEKVKSKYPEIQIIVLSGYNDFNYVKSAFQNGVVDYILKPTLKPEELLKAFESASRKIPEMTISEYSSSSKEFKIKRMLMGYDEDVTAITKEFQKPFFQIMGMDIDSVLGSSFDISRQKQLLDKSAEQHLHDISYITFLLEDNILILLLNLEKGANYNLILKNIADETSENSDVYYVSTPPFEGINQLKNIYENELLPYLTDRFYHQSDHYMNTNDFIKIDNSAMEIPELSSLISAKEMHQAIELVKNHIFNILKERSLDGKLLKTVAQNAIYQIFSLLSGDETNAEEIFQLKRDCIVRINSVQYANQFEEIFSEIVEDLEALAHRYFKKYGESTMVEILSYIDNNYASQLTLKDLAKIFNFNYHYLSTYFSSRNSQGFSEYLNMVRINKAEDLLVNSKASVSDICGMVGFTDHSYFDRVFKKKVGMTPSAYRRHAHKERRDKLC